MNNEIVDLRSDTVTLPCEEMRRAIFEAELGDDVIGDDPSVNRLQTIAAEQTGKMASLFVPSGTMGNQLALMTHCKSSDEVLLSEGCHIVQHEAGGAALLARVQLRTIQPENGSFLTADEIQPRYRESKDIHYPDTGLICLEQATAAGELYPLETLKEIFQLSRHLEVPIHIDGARIFNAAVALGVDVKEISQYCDSLMFCLSKGLSSPVGSLLCGDNDFIDRARKHRKILGGGMRQSGILAAAGLYSLEKMTKRLHEDHESAQALARAIKKIPDLQLLSEPQISLVFFKNCSTRFSDIEFHKALEENEILTYPAENGEFRFVTHYGVSSDDVARVEQVLRRLFSL